MIRPTVGRVVWFYAEKGIEEGGSQPEAAIVAYVHNDALVNLMGIDRNGGVHDYTSIPLCQQGEPRPEYGPYCTWMPYQIGQAKRHEQESK